MSIDADPIRWARHLRALAQPSLEGTPLDRPQDADPAEAWIASFADESGARRRTDAPLLAGLLGLPPPPPPPRLDPEEALWWAQGSDAALDWLGDGPLLPGVGDGAIEPLTERELTALHALWGRRRTDPRARQRCLRAARWHVGELQPDNATALPWAVHVFVELAAAAPDPALRGAALVHAGGLTHAACLVLGRPGVRAACILLDAARQLEADHARA